MCITITEIWKFSYTSPFLSNPSLMNLPVFNPLPTLALVPCYPLGIPNYVNRGQRKLVFETRPVLRRTDLISLPTASSTEIIRTLTGLSCANACCARKTNMSSRHGLYMIHDTPENPFLRACDISEISKFY